MNVNHKEEYDNYVKTATEKKVIPLAFKEWMERKQFVKDKYIAFFKNELRKKHTS